ncbi:MAG: MMPL family transporter [Chloroflexi bacterium]|uniref:MMPL family transporter n=1 Tax=Candidatus Chlorohelix allophototropha TaxID=3003348 RepID=A0A8T7M8X2_9CHLR|nr:MMPL family transporter [Chloroflexota bacterium]WJW68424.1 MMPL family transporter [Chloroflexota bacterium L227-S17]
MYYRFGKFIYRKRWWFVGFWLVVVATSLPFTARVIEPLKIGGFSDPTTESARSAQLLADKLNYSASSIILMFESDTLNARDPRFIQEAQYAVSELKQKFSLPIDLIDFVSNPRQVSNDGKTAYILVRVSSDGEAAAKALPEFKNALKQPPTLKMQVGGGPAYYADVEKVSQSDLYRAEVVAIPIAIVALLFVFGSVIAAALPVLVGGMGVVVILASLFGIAHLTELSIFTLNLATLLGLGLGLDYALFLTSRFREEIFRGRSAEEAVAITLATAGQAVTYSGLTVLIGLCALFVFRINLLVSVAIGGIVVVFVSVMAAITLLPAILAIIGTRINALPVSGLAKRRRKLAQQPAEQLTEQLAEQSGFWAKLSRLVMRRPILIFVATLSGLLILGIPFLSVIFNSPDPSILPDSVQSRQVFDTLRKDFNENEANPILITVQTPKGNILEPGNIYYLYEFANLIKQDPRVDRVDSIVTVEPRLNREQYQIIYANVDAIRDTFLRDYAAQFAKGDTTLISVYSKFPSNSPESRALVEKIRNSQIGNGMSIMVSGSTAGVIDVVNSLYGAFPFAALFIVIATYTVLVLLFRSVVLPLKAIVMNALSIVASYGMLVFVFQEGNFSNILNFKPLNFIEPTIPIIMFCVLFGLSMDYEVFLLSRIKESWENTGDNAASVALGMQRSGRIITSAALIVVLVSLSFVTADMVLVKMLGLGVAIAVGVDATIVRALLVPATMQLLGKWNWYAPKRLLKILPHTKLEAGDFEPILGNQDKLPLVK